MAILEYESIKEIYTVPKNPIGFRHGSFSETSKWNEYTNDYDVESTPIRFCPECGRPASEIIKEWSES